MFYCAYGQMSEIKNYYYYYYYYYINRLIVDKYTLLLRITFLYYLF